MVINKRHDSHLEALIREAATDVRRVNPHIGAPQQPVSDEEYMELERERQELEQVWDAMDRQRGRQVSDEPAARAVDEDRGE